MSGIRPLRRSDLEAVATLVTAASDWPYRPAGLSGYYARTLLDDPWADPEIPSLVFEDDDGSIAAFQGVLVRRASLGGEPVRIACGVNLVSHPDARQRGLGALLMRAFLAGAQDLTITDRATDYMRRVWVTLGGRTSPLCCVDWVRVLRPWSLGRSRLLRPHYHLPSAQQHGPLSRLAGGDTVARAVSALDGVTRRIRPFTPPGEPDGERTELTPAVLVEQLPLVAEHVRLHVAYDVEFVAWLFRELTQVPTRGSPVAKLVTDPTGDVAGWFVYYLKPGGVSHVLQLAASPSRVVLVVDHLLRDAWLGGASAVRGRAEAHLLVAMGERRCFLQYVGGSLLHARDRELANAAAAGDALLTRLDSEWWLGNELAITGPP
jgi:hypothetical protein